MYRTLVLSDTHCGSIVGLTPPAFWNDTNRRWLELLWKFFDNTLRQVGPVDLLVALGDLIDGTQKNDPTALLEPDLGVQAGMAVDIVRMVRAKKRAIVKGTGYHTDEHCSFEKFVADKLETEAVDEYCCDIYGRLCQFRHVIGRSDIPYGQFTQVGKELIREALQALLEEYAAATLVGRAHAHYYVGVELGDSILGIRKAFVNPAMQLKGPKQTKFTRGLRTMYYHVGMTLIEIDRTGWPTVRPILLPLKMYAPREYECLTEQS